MATTTIDPIDDDEALAEASDGFFLAAEHGRSDVLKALADHAEGKLELRRIIDPVTGRSPLHVAVANRKTDAVRVLLAAGFPPDHASFATPTASGGDAVTPYQLAQQLHAHELVFVFHQFLIQQIAANNVESVAQLLRAGVRVDTIDSHATQNSFVHWAITCTARDVLAMLLQRSNVQHARVIDSANADGATPLHLASRAGDVASVRLLLQHGADRSVVGTRGAFAHKTALELSSSADVAALFAAAAVAKEPAPATAVLPTDRQTLQRSPPAARATSSAPPSSSSSSAAVSTTSTTRRPSFTPPPSTASATRLALQLEEKDLLIAQLRKTIETLVVEAQEIRKLGDERVVLDYVRKLRDENAVLQRNLDDADEHMRIQQQQLTQLKTELRRFVVASTASESNADAVKSDALVKAEVETQSPQCPLPSSPLRLENRTESQQTPPSDDGARRSGLLNGLWPFGAAPTATGDSSTIVGDMDGEVIMTV